MDLRGGLNTHSSAPHSWLGKKFKCKADTQQRLYFKKLNQSRFGASAKQIMINTRRENMVRGGGRRLSAFSQSERDAILHAA
jgi:hypothetical protein